MDLLKIIHIHKTYPKFIYANQVVQHDNLQNAVQYFVRVFDYSLYTLDIDDKIIYPVSTLNYTPNKVMTG